MLGRFGRKLNDWYVPAMEPPEPVRSGRERDILAEERTAGRGVLSRLRGGPLAGWRLVVFGVVAVVGAVAYANMSGSADGVLVSDGRYDRPVVDSAGVGGGLGGNVTSADYSVPSVTGRWWAGAKPAGRLLLWRRVAMFGNLLRSR